jgi:hypothetical protein
MPSFFTVEHNFNGLIMISVPKRQDLQLAQTHLKTWQPPCAESSRSICRKAVFPHSLKP